MPVVPVVRRALPRKTASSRSQVTVSQQLQMCLFHHGQCRLTGPGSGIGPSTKPHHDISHFSSRPQSNAAPRIYQSRRRLLAENHLHPPPQDGEQGQSQTQGASPLQHPSLVCCQPTAPALKYSEVCRPRQSSSKFQRHQRSRPRGPEMLGRGFQEQCQSAKIGELSTVLLSVGRQRLPVPVQSRRPPELQLHRLKDFTRAAQTWR